MGVTGVVVGSDWTEAGIGVRFRTGWKALLSPCFSSWPWNFSLKLLGFLLFPFLLLWFWTRASWFYSWFLLEEIEVSPVSPPNFPGFPPNFLPEVFVPLLVLFLLSWFFSGFLTGRSDFPPVSFPDCQVDLLNFLVRLEEGSRGSTQVTMLEGTDQYTMYPWVRLLRYRAIPCESCSISEGKNKLL